MRRFGVVKIVESGRTLELKVTIEKVLGMSYEVEA